MPIRKTCHKVAGGDGNKYKSERKTARIDDQIKREIIIAEVNFFFQTEVKTSKTMQVIGKA